MKILITGGTGFIGRKLVKSFTEEEHQVTILSRSNRSSGNRHVDYRKWDGKKMPPAIGLYDVVINLAGASIADGRWTAEYKQKIRDSRVWATQACVDYINASPNPPKVFISASAIGYYGGLRKEETTESATAGEDFLGKTCKAWEDTALAANCRTVLPRIGLVLGNEGGAFPILTTIYNWCLGGRLASGEQGYSWVHVEDVIGVIRYSIEHEQLEGPVNTVAPEIITQKQFSRALGKAMGRPDPFITPKFLLDLVFGEKSILFWGGQWAVPKKLSESNYPFKFSQLASALNDLV